LSGDNYGVEVRFEDLLTPNVVVRNRLLCFAWRARDLGMTMAWRTVSGSPRFQPRKLDKTAWPKPELRESEHCFLAAISTLRIVVTDQQSKSNAGRI